MDVQPVSAHAGTMLADHSDVVNVQLLDRVVVVPKAIVNVSCSFLLAVVAILSQALAFYRHAE